MSELRGVIEKAYDMAKSGHWEGVSGFLCVRRGNESTTSLSLGPCQAAGGAPG